MPTQVTIPFQPYWQDKMLTGQKICTSRTKRYGNAGDTFQQFNTNFVILSVEKYTLDYIMNNLYKEEGCNIPNDFKRIWVELHPRKGWVPNQKVWVHFFRKED